MNLRKNPTAHNMMRLVWALTAAAFPVVPVPDSSSVGSYITLPENLGKRKMNSVFGPVVTVLG